MGIHICCNDFNYYSSSSKWNAIKYDIFFYCLYYIKTNNIISNDNDIEYDINVRLNSKSNYILNKWCNELINKYYTIFEKLKITGIIILINKKDCDDYYSVDDSSDILNMLRIIYNTLLYPDKTIVDKLMLIFTTSVQQSVIVNIE